MKFPALENTQAVCYVCSHQRCHRVTYILTHLTQELNSPILYLDVMRWCWQQDHRDRPSAEQLSNVLTNPSIPRLVDAVSLHSSNIVTCSCICTLPIEILPPGEVGGDSGDRKGSGFPPPHPHVAMGDLQEELWLCTFSAQGSEVKVINFRGKASQVRKLTCIKNICSRIFPEIC